MALRQTARLGLTVWDADTDLVDRSQFTANFDALDAQVETVESAATRLADALDGYGAPGRAEPYVVADTVIPGRELPDYTSPARPDPYTVPPATLPEAASLADLEDLRTAYDQLAADHQLLRNLVAALVTDLRAVGVVS